MCGSTDGLRLVRGGAVNSNKIMNSVSILRVLSEKKRIGSRNIRLIREEPATLKKIREKLKYFRSLRWRIMLMLVLIGIIPAFITTAVVVRSYKNRAVFQRTSNVKSQCDILTNAIMREGYLENPGSEVLNNELMLLSNVYSGRLLIVDSNYRVIKDTYDIDTGKTSVSPEVLSCYITGKGSAYYDNRNAYIEITSPVTDPELEEVKGVLIASVSTNEIAQTVRDLENQAFFLISIVTVFVLVGGFFLSTLLVRPFREVTHAIEDVTDGYLDEAISVPDYTETESIIGAFNNMLARVRALDNSRNEFVSNVSHELKTPLTSMKVLADSLNGMDNVPVELYQEFMADITQEIDRENNIITSLLAMVRMDKKAAPMNFERIEIGGLLERVIKRLRPIAEKRGISILMEKYRPVMADVDEMKLSLAFSNLIENAVKYNRDDGWVSVSLKSDVKYFYVSVEDSGLGIPEDQIDHIFERFYRGDKSHSTTIEGTGLGLAITRSAITLHRGIIKVQSKVDVGTTFMVRIPIEHKE